MKYEINSSLHHRRRWSTSVFQKHNNLANAPIKRFKASNSQTNWALKISCVIIQCHNFTYMEHKINSFMERDNKYNPDTNKAWMHQFLRKLYQNYTKESISEESTKYNVHTFNNSLQCNLKVLWIRRDTQWKAK